MPQGPSPASANREAWPGLRARRTASTAQALASTVQRLAVQWTGPVTQLYASAVSLKTGWLLKVTGVQLAVSP
jgi:PPE-repeat protein